MIGFIFIVVGAGLLAQGTRLAWRLTHDCQKFRRRIETKNERETRRALLKKLSMRL